MSMPRTIICTAGTSIAKDCPALAVANEACSHWDEDPPGFARQIESRLAGFKLSGLAAPTDLSTEVNSLLLLDCGADDEVVLLAADDAVGRICAEHLESVIPTVFGMPFDLCKVIHVPGLHMRDATRFRREGLPNLIEKLLVYLRDPQRRYARRIVLNPTGGFKGVVPFLTVLGMLYGARVAYVSRSSHQLVSLPPLPLTYDREVFERAREALAWAERQAVFRSEQFFGRITAYDADEHELFEGFLETDAEGNSTLSPLAMVLLEKDREGSGRVLLTPAAMAKLDKLKGTDRARALDLLRRAGSPQWRDRWYHRFATTELDVFGGKALAFRVAGFLRGPDFHVCEFFYQDHDTYLGALHNTRRSQYPRDEDFVPIPAAPEGPTGTDELDEPWSTLLAERDSLKEVVAQITQQRDAAGRQIGEAGKDAERLRRRIGELKQQHHAQLVAMRAELEALRLPQVNAGTTQADAKDSE